ncbi:MAG: hypothetical protein QF919_15235, partial [Nitrospinota bacterium]|nr:hypothetical protein [Nitrospinota bacterium]
MHHEAFSRPEPLLPSPGHPPILLSVGEEGQLHRTGTRIVLSLYHYIKIKSLIKSKTKIICFDSLTRQNLNTIYATTKKHFPQGLLVGSGG